MPTSHRRSYLCRVSIASALGLALLLLGAAAPGPLAQSPWLPEASASTGCFDPVPGPLAAGWTTEGTGTFQAGSRLIVVDSTTGAGDYLNFRCPASHLLQDELELNPRLTVDPGFVAGFVPSGGDTGLHVTINDGNKEIRAVLLKAGPDVLRVALLTQAGYSAGFTFGGLSVDFRLARLTDGSAILSVPGLPAEPVSRIDLVDSSRAGVETIEFGTYDVPARTTSTWDTLGLPTACRNTPTAVLPPIDADGTSTFKIARTIPVKLGVSDCDGVAIGSLAPQIALAKIGEGSGEVNEVASSSAADSGTTMRYDETARQYVFNVSTQRSQFNGGQDLTEGRYRLTISDPSFSAPVIAEFDLRR